MQALRSVGTWALDAGNKGKMKAAATNNLDVTSDYTESSILEAYVRAIRESEHFVYIENQFYISWLGEKNDDDLINDVATAADALRFQSHVVRNPITEALYDRILRAIE